MKKTEMTMLAALLKLAGRAANEASTTLLGVVELQNQCERLGAELARLSAEYNKLRAENSLLGAENAKLRNRRR